MPFSLVCLMSVIVTVLFGAAFLLAPEITGAQYGVAGWNPGTVLVARLFGISLLFLAGAAAAVRHTSDARIQRDFSTWFALASAIATVVSIHAGVTGAVNAMGWVTTATYALFTVAWASVALGRTS